MRTIAPDPVTAALGDPIAPPHRPAPSFARHGDDFSLTTADEDGHAIVVTLTKVRESHDALYAEVAVTRNGAELYFERLNLLSSRRRDVIRTLADRAPDIEWAPIIEPACRQAIEVIRRGTPAVPLRARPAPPVRHLVDPLLLDGEVNVLFGPPATLKSLIAAVLARLVATGGRVAGLAASRRCPVMIADGESNLVEWEGRNYLLERADGATTEGMLHYRRLTRALDTEAAALRSEISRLGVGFLIVDSFGVAAGAEPEGADAAIRLLSTLRGLGPAVTMLLICHVSQASAEQKHGATKPYGSIYVQALGRSIWEARRDDDGGEDVVVSLFHRKSNSTRLHAPVPLRIQFGDQQISVAQATLGERPELLARATLPQQIATALLKGSKTISALAAELDAKEGSVKQAVHRLRDRGVLVRLPADQGEPCPWGLARR